MRSKLEMKFHICIDLLRLVKSVPCCLPSLKISNLTDIITFKAPIEEDDILLLIFHVSRLLMYDDSKKYQA